jgi:hypothetical protein
MRALIPRAPVTQDSTDMATPPAPRLRTSVEPLLRSVQVLSALDVALAAEGDVPRRLVSRAEALLVAAGLAETLAAAEPAERRVVRAVLRAELRLALRLVEGDEAGAAFSETQPALNVAFGDASAGLAAILTREVVPVLDGLGERLGATGRGPSTSAPASAPWRSAWRGTGRASRSPDSSRCRSSPSMRGVPSTRSALRAASTSAPAAART